MAYFDQQDLGNRISLDCWEELYSVNKNYKINSLVVSMHTLLSKDNIYTFIDTLIHFLLLNTFVNINKY